jgi:putative glutathione S-transferase
MVDGIWRGDVAAGDPLAARVARVASGAFRGRVAADQGRPAEPGRYHLYVSFACPFAHRAILARRLKGLEGVVGMSVLHPTWNTPEGWVFGATPRSTPDRAGNGFTRLHQAYAAARPGYTGKVSVPVLWDRVARTIVNNESAEIVRLLDDDGAFGGDPAVALRPPELRPAIDALDARVGRDLAAGVYAVGGAEDQAAYDAATAALFGLLDELDRRLADGRPFLHGDRLTTSDLFAFTPLVRFDAVYNPLFRASRKRLVDHPHLSRFVRRVHELPGVAATVRFDHILMHYHDGDWGVANRRGIVPAPPEVDFRGTAPAA